MKSENIKILLINIIIWIFIAIYIISYINVPQFQISIDNMNDALRDWAGNTNNLIFMAIICFALSLLGSASVGIPIPFPMIIFYMGVRVYESFLEGTIDISNYWFIVLVLTAAGGLGCAIGEGASYSVGYGIKEVSNRMAKKKSESGESEESTGIIKNMDGLGNLLTRNPKWAPWLIFIFAVSPLPDDALFVPLGIIKYPFRKVLIPGWFGKSFTVLSYIWLTPVIFEGLPGGGNPVFEMILFGISMSIILLSMGADWGKINDKMDKQSKSKIVSN
ncbi:MAG: hypothetical protein GY870_06305 [archaeon]|nr:hypothetical protein [archaeon]